MKAKYLLLIVLGLTICFTAEGQIFKKIKKKAEKAAERTILRKTDEAASKATEKAIDEAVQGKESKTEPADSTVNGTMTNGSSGNSIGPGRVKAGDPSKLPDQYEFDWELQMEMTSSKGDALTMNYLLNSEISDYAAMEMTSEQTKQNGTVQMVMDSKVEAMIMFMNAGGNNMASINKLPNVNKKVKEEDYTYKEIGTKTILGYECYGIELENDTYKTTIFFTLEAAVNFSAIFSFSKDSAPKGFDPALIEVLKEEALLMEMTAENKKKSKESFTMTAKSLEKREAKIKKADYRFMKMPGY